ncbi:hypothetical protein RI367_000792 [Sorochytrium milnesiophthora]
MEERAALSIQTWVRSRWGRRHFLRARSAAVTVQRYVRGWLCRRRLKQQRKIACVARDFEAKLQHADARSKDRERMLALIRSGVDPSTVFLAQIVTIQRWWRRRRPPLTRCLTVAPDQARPGRRPSKLRYVTRLARRDLSAQPPPSASDAVDTTRVLVEHRHIRRRFLALRAVAGFTDSAFSSNQLLFESGFSSVDAPRARHLIQSYRAQCALGGRWPEAEDLARSVRHCQAIFDCISPLSTTDGDLSIVQLPFNPTKEQLARAESEVERLKNAHRPWAERLQDGESVDQVFGEEEPHNPDFFHRFV